MLMTFVGAIIVGLIILTAIGVVSNDVYRILKLVNHETSVDRVAFDKCILPYKKE